MSTSTQLDSWFPFETLVDDMRDVVASLLDPASRKALALTSKSHYARFNDPNIVGQYFADEIIKAGHLELLKWALSIGTRLDLFSLEVAAAPSTPHKPELARVILDLYENDYFSFIPSLFFNQSFQDLYRLVGMSGDKNLVERALTRKSQALDFTIRHLANGLPFAPNFQDSWSQFCRLLNELDPRSDSDKFDRERRLQVENVLPEVLANDLVEVLPFLPDLWDSPGIVVQIRGKIMPEVLKIILDKLPQFAQGDLADLRKRLDAVVRLSPPLTVRLYLEHLPQEFFESYKGRFKLEDLDEFKTATNIRGIKVLFEFGLFDESAFLGPAALAEVSETSSSPLFLEMIQFFIQKSGLSKPQLAPIADRFLNSAHYSLNVPYVKYLVELGSHPLGEDIIWDINLLFLPLVSVGFRNPWALKVGIEYLDYLVSTLRLDRSFPKELANALRQALAAPLQRCDISILYRTLIKVDQKFIQKHIGILISKAQFLRLLSSRNIGVDPVLSRSIRITEVVSIATLVLNTSGNPFKIQKKEWLERIAVVKDKRLRDALELIEVVQSAS